ncbi:uncharacterized protein [Apostichopus japonicus]|uniref:uncharacterized protein isoform X2 n=1 Tax=Stichopus japonicus TaxID=307972 RepID=UPI003AB14156
MEQVNEMENTEGDNEPSVHAPQEKSTINGDSVIETRLRRQRRKKTFADEGEVAQSNRYKQKYIPKWERIPEYQAWLTRNPKTRRAHCLYCNVDINIDKGKTQLSRHCQRIKHRKNERLWHRKPLKSQPTAAAVVKSSCKFLGQQVQHAEAQLIFFLVENNLPLSLTDPLSGMVQMLPSIGDPVQRLMLSPEKATSMVTQGFSCYFKQNVFEKLKNVVFSVVLDVAHDKHDNRHLVVCITFCDKKLQLQVDVLDIFEVQGNSVESLFDKLRATLTEMEEAGVPPKNWVGFLIDTTNDLYETTHHLAILINEYYPWVIPIRSPCHMTHLAASSACGRLPTKLENVCKLLHAHFKTNPNQLAPLLEFQEFCRLKEDKVLVPGQDCWLSVHNFIKQIVNQWDTLNSYFSKLITDSVNDVENDTICKILQDSLMKVLFQFVEHVLCTISTYNKTFQMEEPFFFQLQRETVELIRKLTLSFMRRDVVQSISDIMDFPLLATDFLPLSQVYLGLEASSTLAALISQSQLSYESSEVLELLELCQNFYKDIVVEIQSRFDFSHPIFHLASIINPQNALDLKPATLSEFFANYDHPEWNKNEIESEWRAVSNLKLPSEREILHSPLLFWRYVLSQRTANGDFKFSNLQQVVLFFLSLPFSSVVGAKVSRFLKRINIGGRLNLLHADLEGYAKLQSGTDMYGVHQQRRRRKNVKKDAVQM